MANVLGIHAVGESLANYLRNAYPQAMRENYNADFQLIATNQLADAEASFATGVTLLLYRVTTSEYARNARPMGAPDAPPAISLNLHYLLTAWADDPETEQVILAWAMRQLHQTPLLDASTLLPTAQWKADEVIHVVPAELTTEDMMRVWDALAPSYRLSVSYIARVVTIDADLVPAPERVVATRLELGG